MTDYRHDLDQLQRVRASRLGQLLGAVSALVTVRDEEGNPSWTIYEEVGDKLAAYDAAEEELAAFRERMYEEGRARRIAERTGRDQQERSGRQNGSA